MMDTDRKVNELRQLLNFGRMLSVANYEETRPRMNRRNTLLNDNKRNLLQLTPCMWALNISNVGKRATTGCGKQDNDAYDSSQGHLLNGTLLALYNAVWEKLWWMWVLHVVEDGCEGNRQGLFWGTVLEVKWRLRKEV